MTQPDDPLNLWAREFVAQGRVARLATVDEHGQPYAVPIVYALSGRQLYTPIDAKPKSVEAGRLRRVRNIQAEPRVAVIVDEYDEDWQRLAWVQLRGRAALFLTGDQRDHGADLLREKYPQYAAMPLDGRPVMVIEIETVSQWRAAGAAP